MIHGFLIGIVLGLVGLVMAIIIWTSLPRDPVGRPARKRRQESGLQGRVSEWLYWDAALSSPDVADLEDASESRHERVGDRAFNAVIGNTQAQRQVSRAEAHRLLLKEVRSPAARAFLQGHMRRATRLHWRRRYTGPPSLFPTWYYLVAYIRYGRRHLYLETLAAVLQEMRKHDS